MTEQNYHLDPSEGGKALLLLAEAYDNAAMNGMAKRIRLGTVTGQDLIAVAAIEKALAKRRNYGVCWKRF
ncbi:hypothetical protein C8J45_103358 [Sphingomonas sp. PP-CE-3G-477]|uniref:hypothetical protein n=1 Tax=Sphingomonas sp. PP-CE-3G-477 TaxID=2135660 RepID=UPI000D388899|nr:hypothetical protein [Sphingomonas sp. PP-CE-3G-477]PTQ64508.1 hypothetical protein C8J45_103358 [Sphingomonas sp. PP-CE-3G-477]